MKFITDSSLGKLAKWMRILGYDTIYYRGIADRTFLRKAEKEKRIVLTRKRDITQRSHPGEIVVLHSDRVQEQIGEVIERFGIAPDPGKMFGICLACNEPLTGLPRETARARVPDYIFSHQKEFLSCRKCGRIYWPGSHRDRAMTQIRLRTPGGPP